MLKWLATALVLTCFSSAGAAQMDRVLLDHPAMSQTQIVFEYGGELWSVPRTGGQAHVLASGMDLLAQPIFSPDGSQIAFSGTYDKNTDVYVIPASWRATAPADISSGSRHRSGLDAGRQERSLQLASLQLLRSRSALYGTRHAAGSRRSCRCRVAKWARIPPTAARLPMFRDSSGSLSGRATRAASTPRSTSPGCRTRARCGSRISTPTRATPCGSATRSTFSPTATVRRPFTPTTPIPGRCKRLIDNKGFDITSASAGPGGIVYSQFGELHIYDFATGTTHAVPVTVAGDLPQRRPYFEDAARRHPGVRYLAERRARRVRGARRHSDGAREARQHREPHA